MVSKADLVSALLELTSSREGEGVSQLSTKCYGPGPPVLVQENHERFLEVSLKLRSSYIFTHPYESSSLKKKTIPRLCKAFQGRENVKHPKV